MDEDNDREKKYTIVQDANGQYYAVTNDEGEADQVQKLAAFQSTLEGYAQTAETAVSNLLRPLGSGVRVKAPKIFD